MSILVILAVTLVPGSRRSSGLSGICFLCGEFGLADMLRNVVLFVPLGIALGGRGRSLRGTIVPALLLSTGIELAQTFLIVGRDGNPTDILSNSLGALIGWGLIHTYPWWVAPEGRLQRRLAVAAFFVGAALLIGTLFLLRPAPPPGVYYGQWTPDLRSLAEYEGEVLGAWVGEVPVSNGRFGDSETLRDRLVRREPITVRVVAGPPPRSLAPIFAIADRSRRHMMLVGADGADLVYEYRSLASNLRLDRPQIRGKDLLRDVQPGDTVDIAVRWTGDSYCLSVDARLTCGLGGDVGRGWAVLEYPNGAPEGFISFLDFVWLALLFFPMGYWSSTAARAGVGAALVWGVLLTLGITWPAVVTAGDYLAPAAGILGGFLLSRFRARRSRSAPPPVAVGRA